MSKKMLIQFFKFCCVGVVNTAINYGLFAILLLVLKINYLFSGALSFICGAIVGYFLNRRWTFEESNIRRHLILEYMLINLFSLLVNIFIQWIAVEHLGILKIYSQFFGLVVTTIINFVLSKMLFVRNSTLSGSHYASS